MAAVDFQVYESVPAAQGAVLSALAEVLERAAVDPTTPQGAVLGLTLAGQIARDTGAEIAAMTPNGVVR